MQRLVQMLFSDREAAPTIDRIEPGENDPRSYTHILAIKGQTALLDGPGPNGLYCVNHYRCLDDSMFARAMRLLRICVRVEDYEGQYPSGEESPYVHLDTGTIIPQEEIARVTQLVRERA